VARGEGGRGDREQRPSAGARVCAGPAVALAMAIGTRTGTLGALVTVALAVAGTLVLWLPRTLWRSGAGRR
jgi:hypothetical protein